MGDETTNEEEGVRAQSLRRERIKTNRSESLQLKGAEKLLELIENGHKTTAILIALVLAIISDFADLSLIPAIPIVGDFLDIITGGILTVFFWHIGGFIKWKVRFIQWGMTAFELLPFVLNDLFPSFTIGVLLAWHIINKEAKNAEEQMEALGLNIEQLEKLEKEQY